MRRRDVRRRGARRPGGGGVLAGVLLGAALVLGGVADAAPRPRVAIVLIDGLDARRFAEALMPTVWGLATGAGAAGAFYPDARAVMPTVTNTNHVSIMTGAYAEAHGIVGNMFWDLDTRRAVRSEHARHLQVETLFTVIERRRPELMTAALFGKSRLVSLFAADGRQRAPDVLWGDVATESEATDANEGFASDRRTMDAVLDLLARERRVDLLFVALPDVDRTSHVFGPESHQARAAMLEADRQVTRLVGALKRDGAWDETVLMITSDHGFVSVAADAAAGRPYPVVTIGRSLAEVGLDAATVGVLGAGGLETLVLRGGDDPATLARLRKQVLAQPGVIEAWYRAPNPADGGEAFTLGRAHPDWRMSHPRVGDLVLAAAPGHHFVDPFSNWAAAMSGTHGGPDVQAIPIVVTGGHPWLRRERPGGSAGAAAAANPDLGATAAWLLDVPAPRMVDGGKVPDAVRGRVLEEAFAR